MRIGAKMLLSIRIEDDAMNKVNAVAVDQGSDGVNGDLCTSMPFGNI
jgi:hypothetical protein